MSKKSFEQHAIRVASFVITTLAGIAIYRSRQQRNAPPENSERPAEIAETHEYAEVNAGQGQDEMSVGWYLQKLADSRGIVLSPKQLPLGGYSFTESISYGMPPSVRERIQRPLRQAEERQKEMNDNR